MNQWIKGKLLLALIAMTPMATYAYRITYNSGPDSKGGDAAKSNINVLVFTNEQQYEQLVKEKKITDRAQQILNTYLTASEYFTEECAPEFAPEAVILDEIGDILIGWLFKVIKAIETDIATIHKHTNQKTGAVMEWTPATSQLDGQGWVYMVIVVAKNDTDAKGTVLMNRRIKPDAEFGINLSYDGTNKKYNFRYEPAKTVNDVGLASFILCKDSLVRLHGIEFGPPANKSNIEASICDWNISPSSPFVQVTYNTTAGEYQLPKCPAMKTFINANYPDAWPAWQKALTGAFTMQKRQPGNPQYNNFNNMTTQQMAVAVPGVATYAGSPENANTLSRAYNDALAKNKNKTNICN